MSNLKHADVTGQIIKDFYKVYNTPGFGFAEKVYENSLFAELVEAGFLVKQQEPINVFYNGKLVGEYFADLIVEDCVIVEMKASVTLVEAHEAQLLNYLKATKIEVGLLLNFGQKPEYRRKFFTNDRKDLLSILLNPSESVFSV
ncbi:MAG: GxxExxY protein [Pyrinomonadaceae bacterium]